MTKERKSGLAMSNRTCHDAKSTLRCVGFIFLLLLAVGFIVGIVCAPIFFATRTLPKYRNYLDEEQHHVIRECTNITIKEKGKNSN